MKKNTLITIIIIVLVIIFAIIVKTWNSNPETPEEKIAKCIGENSVLYVQTGCPGCEYQESLFGENLKYLNIIDCKLDEINRQKCINAGITGTPTWIINGEKYERTHSISTLQQLTGCEFEQTT